MYFRYITRIALAVMLLGVVRAEVPRDANQLRILIIAVNEFASDSTFKDSDLEQEMLRAGQELDQYFRQHFNVTPEFLHTKAETRSEPLKKWLHNYFRTTQQTTTLIFVLTHGIGSRTPAQTAYNSELYLATADATKSNIEGVGIQARAELLNYFRMLPNGSSVFLFLDTCDAASIDSAGLQRDLDADHGHRIMIIASSHADQKSYQARFTKTLQKLWETPSKDCSHEPKAIEKLITTSMDEHFPLTTPSIMKQDVKVIRAYSQDFCLESFGADQALLLVGNPSITDEVNVYYHVVGDLQELPGGAVRPGDVLPLKLSRQRYSVRVAPSNDSGNGSYSLILVDFENGNFVQFFPLSNVADPFKH